MREVTMRFAVPRHNPRAAQANLMATVVALKHVTMHVGTAATGKYVLPIDKASVAVYAVRMLSVCDDADLTDEEAAAFRKALTEGPRPGQLAPRRLPAVQR